MSKKYYLVLIVVFINLFNVSGQKPAATINQANIQQFFTALEKANLEGIEVLLNEEIDLCIKDDQQINEKTEAINRLKSFLSSHTIKSVSSLHQGANKGSKSEYKVAKLITDKEVFRLFIYTEKVNKEIKINEIRIDKF